MNITRWLVGIIIIVFKRAINVSTTLLVVYYDKFQNRFYLKITI